MEGQLSVPFHFAVEFLVLVVVAGAGLDALRKRRHGAGAWSLGQALGFAALGASQAVHGSLLFEADGDPVVLGLRTAGFLILAASARPAHDAPSPVPPVAVGAGAFLFVPGAEAGWAVVPALAALVVAVRGVRAHRLDQDPATFAFAAAFVAFAAAEGLTAFSGPDGGTMLAVAHGARFAAGLFLARWLWAAFVHSIRMRYVSAFVLVLALVAIVISGALNVVLGGTLQDEELKRLGDAGEARVAQVRTLGQSAIGSAAQFSQNETIARELDERRGGGYFDQVARQAFRLLPANADLILFADRRGRVLGSAEPDADGAPAPLPEAQALRIAGSDVVAEAIQIRGPTASPQAITYATGQEGDVALEIIVLGASPATVGNRVAGVVVVGYRIDRSYLEEVKQDTGAEATLAIANRVAATTLGDPDAVAGALDGLQGELRGAREERRTVTAVFGIGRDRYVSSFVPLMTEDRQVAGLLALSRRVDVLAEAQARIARTLFLITLAAVAVAALLAWLSGGRVTEPIRSLTGAARELRGGNLAARAPVRSRDEVGSLGTAFNEMATELQRSNSALRLAAVEEATLRARMEAILESMVDGLVATDAEGRVVTVNRAMAELLGRRADRAQGRPLGEVLDGVTAAGRPLATTALSGRSAQGTLRRAGGSVPVAITSSPLRDADGQESGRVVVVRDISVEQQAERMKSEFLSNVSHELRTPITPIKGYAEIMRRKKFPRDKAEQFLDGIIDSTSRLERIVEILVDFAAIEAGRLQPRTEAIQVGGLVDDLASRWRARSPRHRFVRRCATRLPPVLGDRKLIGRVLDELMDNAVKFSPDGGRIEIEAGLSRNGTQRAKRIEITVRDKGIGIDPDRVPDLFQDFLQLDGSETRSFGGLGLGLAYVKRIADVHGGAIEVDSEPGKGSAFTLVLPTADRTGKAATVARLGPAGAAKRSSAKTPRRAAAAKRTASKETKRKTTARKTTARKTTRGKRVSKRTGRKDGRR